MAEAVEEDLWSTVELQEGTDCIMTVAVTEDDTPEVFKVHQSRIRGCSPVFNAMLKYDSLESLTGVIDVIGVKPYVMERCLKRIYGREIEEDLTILEIQELMIVADRYDIRCINASCANYLKRNFFNIDSCVNFLVNLELFTFVKEFKQSCFELLEENAEVFLRNEFLFEITTETFMEILEMENLKIKNELALIEFGVRWAARQNNSQQYSNLQRIENLRLRKRRRLMEDVVINFEQIRRLFLERKLFSKFRFLTLTNDELKTDPNLKFLRSEEITEITAAVEHLKEHRKLPANYSSNLSRIDRARAFEIKSDLIGKNAPFNIYSIRLDYKWRYFDKWMTNVYLRKNSTEFSFKTQFAKNKFVGYELDPPLAYGPADFEATFVIYDANGKLIEKIVKIFTCTDKLQFLFRRGFFLKHDTEYKITLNFGAVIPFSCCVDRNSGSEPQMMQHRLDNDNIILVYNEEEETLIPHSSFIFQQKPLD